MLPKNKLPKYHEYNGKKFKLIWRKPRNCDGLCEDPKNPAPERFIQINPNDSIEEVCNTLIHESLHAELWDLDEDAVTRIADEITDLLVKCGLISNI
jgi:hypothetical protein